MTLYTWCLAQQLNSTITYTSNADVENDEEHLDETSPPEFTTRALPTSSSSSSSSSSVHAPSPTGSPIASLPPPPSSLSPPQPPSVHPCVPSLRHTHTRTSGHVTSDVRTRASVCSQVEDEVTTNVTGKCKISDDNRSRKPRETEGKRNHASVVASNTRMTSMNGEASDSDRSDVTSLEGKCPLHINVLS